MTFACLLGEVDWWVHGHVSTASGCVRCHSVEWRMYGGRCFREHLPLTGVGTVRRAAPRGPRRQARTRPGLTALRDAREVRGWSYRTEHIVNAERMQQHIRELASSAVRFAMRVMFTGSPNLSRETLGPVHTSARSRIRAMPAHFSSTRTRRGVLSQADDAAVGHALNGTLGGLRDGRRARID